MARCLSILLAAFFALYLGAAQAWTQLPQMQHARSESSAIDYKGDVYVFNGFDANVDIVPSVEKLDGASLQWTEIGSTSVLYGTAVTHNGIVRVDNKVWIIGGRLGDHPGRVTDAVWIYNLDSGTWQAGPSLPSPAAAGGAALIGNKVHYFGGLDPEARCDIEDHLVYDLADTVAGWQDITATAAMPHPRNHFSTVVVNEKIYAIGGQFGHDGCPGKNGSDTTLVHAFDPLNSSWERLADLPSRQSHAEPSTFAHDGQIYMVGGQINGNKVLRYDPPTDTWTTAFTLPQKLLAPVARMIDGQLVVAGGGAPSVREPTTVVYAERIEPSTNNDNPASDVSEASESQIIVLEAEVFSNRSDTPTHQWVNSSLSGASENNSMITTPNSGALRKDSNNNPMLSYNVHFAQPGEYFIWIRGWGDANSSGEGRNDSLHAGLNGDLFDTSDKIDGFPATGWTWSASTRDGSNASITVPTAGQHDLNLWMREDGLAIDKILLVNDPDYIPEDHGPVASNIDTGDNSTDTPAADTDDPTPENSAPIVTSDPETEPEITSQTPSTARLISREAEDFDVRSDTATHQWINSTLASASGGGAMVTTPDSGALRKSASGSPMLSYLAYFNTPGTYHVWVRGWGDANAAGEGRNDSLHTGLNGTLASTADKIDGFPKNGWTWSRHTRDGNDATLSIPSEGMHAFNIWMREDGLAIDKFVITSDASYTPAGLGPAISSDDSGDEQQENEQQENTPPIVNAGNDQTGGDTPAADSPPADSSDTIQPVSSGLILLEAESFIEKAKSSSHEWGNAGLPDASGQGSMITSPNIGALRSDSSDSPKLSYSINFDKAGIHYIWIRGWGDANAAGEGKNDSLHAGLNGALATSASKIDGFFEGGWTWSRSTRNGPVATLNVPTAGIHTLNLWMREDGLAVDKIAISTDPDYTPEQNTQNSSEIVNNSPLIDAWTAWEIQQTADGSAVQARHEAGAVEVNGKIYVVGGRGNRAVQSFDPVTNRWSSHGRPPVDFHHFQPVAIGNAIYVIAAFTGGYPDEIPYEHIYKFTTNNHKWSRVSTVPADRRRGSAGAAAYNGKIYLVGGNRVGHRGPSVTWLDVFDPTDNSWIRLPDAPHARDHVTIAIADGKLVVAGGRRSNLPNVFANTESATDVFNILTGEWESNVEDIPTERAGTMTVSHGSEVIVIGGESMNRSAAHDHVEAFDVTTGRWRELQKLNVGRHSGGAAILGNKIHVISGNSTRGGGAESTIHETLELP